MTNVNNRSQALGSGCWAMIWYLIERGGWWLLSVRPGWMGFLFFVLLWRKAPQLTILWSSGSTSRISSWFSSKCGGGCGSLLSESDGDQLGGNGPRGSTYLETWVSLNLRCLFKSSRCSSFFFFFFSRTNGIAQWTTKGSRSHQSICRPRQICRFYQTDWIFYTNSSNSSLFR